MTVSLQVNGVSKEFVDRRSKSTVRALDEINLEVQKGEVICILGPSGCGKSTLLNIVAGFLPPSGGEVRVDGRPVVEPGPDRGFVFQEFALFPWRTVLQNIEFGPVLKGMEKGDRHARARELIQRIHLTGFEDKFPFELSGGMKQRVGIARALANDPEVLLMDEPFGALDAQTRRVMQEELLKLLGETQKTVLFVTHAIDEAIVLADRVMIMTARPGQVKALLGVDLPRPRERTSPEFNELYRTMDDLIRVEVEKSLEVQDSGAAASGEGA
ncbi:MAG: ABC transporter ATP-binding protein [Nitrospinae bacterium]|nr:ABC transporter ATP-binding protein [Nitrospinota bacterium]